MNTKVAITMMVLFAAGVTAAYRAGKSSGKEYACKKISEIMNEKLDAIEKDLKEKKLI